MRILITGGAGFIGSHLAEMHLMRGDQVHVVDDLTTGNRANLAAFQTNPYLSFEQADVLTWDGLDAYVAWADRIYNMAAVVGMFRPRFDLMSAAFFVFPATIAAYCWWFALRGHIAESRARMRITLIGGVILGGIGFAAGFFGPIVFAPEANQGPLLGIFITGPFGFVLGSAAGCVYAHTRRGTPGDLSRTDGRANRAA